MNTQNPKPDDSGVMLMAVLSMLVSRLDAPYALIGCMLVMAAIVYRWKKR
ncbi:MULTISPECIES: hypothetical protein [Bifidobacterium]|uniref:Uncharacterized protein n=2 Tax=Bifidobacterium TaxID=1678 RepID=A0A2N3R6H7_9BIFI|nr:MULTISPECIES: hypothetical protein [Bifidobacterium]PAU67928.1 hypothetical protein B1526_0903 [Bifidobacterium criceti]PKV04937.1 hypothetical protein CQR50_0191 [Bifidobacterium pseudolongum subsp. globosum]